MPNNEKGQQGQSHGNKSGSSEMDDKMKSGKGSQGGNRNTGNDSGNQGRGGSDSGRSGGSSGRSGSDR